MRFVTTSIAAVLFAIQLVHAADQEHTIEIEITVSEGTVGAHFSRWEGSVEAQNVVDPSGTMLEMNIPTGKKKLKKIKNRNADTEPIDSANPWKEKFTVSGNGVYVLNLSDWRKKPAAHVKLTIDGEVRFEGSGSKDNLDKWSDKKFTGKTRKTDDLEICVDLKK